MRVTAGDLNPAGLQALVWGLPSALALLDRELRLVAWSEPWARASAVADAALAGRSLLEVCPETPPELRELLRACLAGEREHADCLQPPGDEHAPPVRHRVRPWRDAEGRPIGLSVTREELSDELLTRRRLRERESFQQLLFERSTVGMNLCRLDGLWVESNPAFLEILGYPREEADGGLTYWSLTPREYDDQEAAQLEALEATGRYGPYEKEFMRKDGSRVPVRLNGFFVERDGERYIWSLIEDISDRRRLEAQFHAERLKAIKASKLAGLGELAAGVAHEINNPLAIVEGYLEVLRGIRPGDAPPLYDEALEQVSKAVDRAAQIVRSLRKIARQDTGSEPRPVSLRSVIEDTLDLYRARFRGRGVDLRLRLDADARVRVRPNELAQVLINLLNNAAHAVAGLAESWIALETERPAADTIRVRVSDTGPGIPGDLRDKVFDPFFTTKEVGQGTGLGLSISQRIVSEFGGSLTVDPRHPPTSLLIDLPVAAEDARG